MKKNNYNPNSISTIVNYGETVYNENGNAVFVTKATADIDLDDDDEVAEFTEGLRAFSDALKNLNYEIVKEVKDGHFLTSMPFSVYSRYAGLTKEQINDISIVSHKIEEMLGLHVEGVNLTKVVKKAGKSFAKSDNGEKAADIILNVWGELYKEWKWVVNNKSDVLEMIDPLRFRAFEWITKEFVEKNKVLLNEIERRGHCLSAN